MNKKTLVFAVSALGVAALIYLFAPDAKLEPFKSLFRSAKINECLEMWRPRFDNPDSLVYVDSYEWHENGWHQLRINYRAKNMFGASVSNYLMCGLDQTGLIDPAETFKHQADRSYGLIGNGPGDYPVAAPAPAPAPR